MKTVVARPAEEDGDASAGVEERDALAAMRSPQSRHLYTHHFNLFTDSLLLHPLAEHHREEKLRAVHRPGAQL